MSLLSGCTNYFFREKGEGISILNVETKGVMHQIVCLVLSLPTHALNINISQYAQLSTYYSSQPICRSITKGNAIKEETSQYNIQRKENTT